MIPRDNHETDTNFTKQESNTTRSQDHNDHHHHHNAQSNNNFKSMSTSTTTASSWSRLKDPRIVRVSRAFGGKDRHSKVCTVRGLRDRRVRLSVPTAIQLYDLQDRLGLNQPSKVVDWLLEAAKHEIEELPPLQIPPGAFTAQNLQPVLASSDQAKHGLNIFGEKLKEVSGENTSAEFNLENSSSMSNLMNSTSYNIRWDPSNLTLSSSAAHHPPRLTAQNEDWHNFNLVPLQPTISHNHHQVLVYQPGMSTTQSYFPQNNNTDQFDDPNKQVNFHNSTVESTNAASTDRQPVRPIHFNMSTANLLPSHNNEGR